MENIGQDVMELAYNMAIIHQAGLQRHTTASVAELKGKIWGEVDYQKVNCQTITSAIRSFRINSLPESPLYTSSAN